MTRPTSSIKVTVNQLPGLTRQLEDITYKEILVGVPDTKATRRTNGQRKINNAVLAYIHDNGSPLARIPPRPFLRKGIEENRVNIAKQLGFVVQALLAGDNQSATKALHRAGMTARDAVKRKITTGPFTPLKPATIAARKRRHKNRKNTRVTPLIDTGQMRNSINYVIREKK